MSPLYDRVFVDVGENERLRALKAGGYTVIREAVNAKGETRTFVLQRARPEMEGEFKTLHADELSVAVLVVDDVLAAVVGQRAARAFTEAGYATVDALLMADGETLIAIPGIGSGTLQKFADHLDTLD